MEWGTQEDDILEMIAEREANPGTGSVVDAILHRYPGIGVPRAVELLNGLQAEDKVIFTANDWHLTTK
jgi:hypothetical protein